MKTKLYTLISIYLFISAILSQFFKDYTSLKFKEYFILGILFILLVVIVVKLITTQTIAFSLIFRQLLLIIIAIFSLNFTYFYLFFILTMLLYYTLNCLHEKKLIKTSKKIYYHLKINNNSLLTLVYLVYGLLSYLIIYLDNIDFPDSFALLSYAFYPYMIIIFILICLKHDSLIDNFYSNTYFQKVNKKLIFVNILTIILFLL